MKFDLALHVWAMSTSAMNSVMTPNDTAMSGLRALVPTNSVITPKVTACGCSYGIASGMAYLGCPSEDNAAGFGLITVHHKCEKLVPNLLHFKEPSTSANVRGPDFCSDTPVLTARQCITGSIKCCTFCTMSRPCVHLQRQSVQYQRDHEPSCKAVISLLLQRVAWSQKHCSTYPLPCEQWWLHRLWRFCCCRSS